MIRLAFSIELNYDIISPESDFIFSIHAAMTQQQILIHEQLDLSQSHGLSIHANPMDHTRVMRFRAKQGSLKVSYQATVDLLHVTAHPNQIQETHIANLPLAVLPYLYPSRYCQSDQFKDIVNQNFAQLMPGYLRVQGIRDWVFNHVKFQSNSSTDHTTATDTLQSGVGVCRDFSHLMIALCRALNVPARFVTGIDYGSDPALGPTDFHAYVEAYLDGRWYIFDPSRIAIPMGLVRLGTGRDASDTAIATIFGNVRGSAPIIAIEAVANADGRLQTPMQTLNAISVDAH
jgi:transglutaminase-like putative cysteine protease